MSRQCRANNKKMWQTQRDPNGSEIIIRKEEVMAIKSKFPTKIPLIVERYHKERNLPTLDKKKFLVPEDITMSQFLVIIRNRIRVKPNQALYLIINNRSMLSMSLTMAQAYENYGDEDGFLYITYASQEVFGYQDDMQEKSNREVEAIRHRFPNKVPLYVTRYVRDREVPVLGRTKFLVPQELTMSQFLYIIRTKMKLRDSQALYLLVNDKVLASHSMTMAQAYQQFRSHDGYLHITYAAQQVFG
ncbi:microtubule-associated proteins 1A/1B light chain 3C isoform X2 [Bombyx mori]|uniref:Uncharacterized protein n=1 Tax=Bombyx mori TaxID=7091 RepID=A0A8R1WK24_BOMMO|nr:microtubule-associated proteins 1A/1B light chain 3C isoform X4 [Bombyx mori]